MLAKYSIRTKIVTVVAFLLVAMTGMGLLAVGNMRAINANTVGNFETSGCRACGCWATCAPASSPIAT